LGFPQGLSGLLLASSVGDDSERKLALARIVANEVVIIVGEEDGGRGFDLGQLLANLGSNRNGVATLAGFPVPVAACVAERMAAPISSRISPD
jgi:hypothetical protein